MKFVDEQGEGTSPTLAALRVYFDPAAAVEQLRARLSDAFDRFLEGVADNRQVAFDDDGWRLNTDAAEQPDPAQSDRLAELHRWLDARSRSIRLADLLIEVENDLGFSVHFQQPGEKRVDPWGGVRAAGRDPRPRLQPRPLHHWRRSPPTSPTGRRRSQAQDGLPRGRVSASIRVTDRVNRPRRG